MAWEKRGLIFKPSGESSWMKTHAQVPRPLLLDDKIRVFIGTRPEQQQSLITYIDVDIKDPTKVLYVHDKPILELGKPGTFDEFGLMPNLVMHVDDEVWLYYLGWQRQHTVPCQTMVGLAISKDGGNSFKRAYEGPIMPISKNEPYSTIGPSIIREENLWRMWYSSGEEWLLQDDIYERKYHIYYAESQNGIDWLRDGKCCVPRKTDDESANSPAVIFDGAVYHMWFSYRTSKDYRGGDGSYRMGYATSKDGKNWERDDKRAGIDVSAEGWDSEMIAYPFILDTPAGKYMFYNGNGFGTSGFGYAVWEDA